jgi:hypothetical protein
VVSRGAALFHFCRVLDGDGQKPWCLAARHWRARIAVRCGVDLSAKVLGDRRETHQ